LRKEIGRKGGVRRLGGQKIRWTIVKRTTKAEEEQVVMVLGTPYLYTLKKGGNQKEQLYQDQRCARITPTNTLTD
jgi:hypothetical protein